MELKSVEERNADFQAMTKVERRKAVATDALAQLRAGRFVAQSGVYELFFSKAGDVLSSSGFLDSCERGLKEAARCECCAKGALYLSSLRRFNGAPIEGEEFPYRDDLLKAIFGREMADLAEDAFEGVNINGRLPGEEARAFYDAFPTDRQRLRQILLAILAHPRGILTRSALRGAIKQPLEEARP